MDIRALQAFGAGNVQGGIALCGSQGCDGMNSNSNSTGSEGDDRETSEVVRDIVIILLVGVAAVAGIVLITYTTALVSDRYCCCFPWFRPITNSAEFNARFDRGAVARKARLWGLTLEERARVLAAFFEKRIFLYQGVNHETVNETANETLNETLNETTSTTAQDNDDSPTKENLSSKEKDVEKDVEKGEQESSDKEEGEEQEEKQNTGGPNWLGDAWKSFVAPEQKKDSTTSTNVATNGEEDTNKTLDQDDKDSKPHDSDEEEEEQALQDADHERICCICLNEYETDNQLITGTQCTHRFHYTCCMEWLGKNDHCPYCRQEMITATQFRQAALETLGQERVKELGASGQQQQPANPTVASLPTMTQNAADPQVTASSAVDTSAVDTSAVDTSAVDASAVAASAVDASVTNNNIDEEQGVVAASP